MLSETKFPNHYWGETLYTVMHVLNLTPTIALNSEVPDKIWFGKNVKYDHLRFFGCKVFIHIGATLAILSNTLIKTLF